MYGFLRGLLPTLNQARKDGRPWVYADRGYFRATYGDDHTGFFRVTRNAFQHDGRDEGGNSMRWGKLMLSIHPWRRGRHILVCPPGDVFTQAMQGRSARDWFIETMGQLAAHTDRPIRVRQKPKKTGVGVPLADDLQDCHALVTFMSNTAVEAVLAGVPVFCTGRCAGGAMGSRSLAAIESPSYPDNRLEWASALANSQWTLEEIRTGAANAVFRELT